MYTSKLQLDVLLCDQFTSLIFSLCYSLYSVNCVPLSLPKVVEVHGAGNFMQLKLGIELLTFLVTTAPLAADAQLVLMAFLVPILAPLLTRILCSALAVQSSYSSINNTHLVFHTVSLS